MKSLALILFLFLPLAAAAQPATTKPSATRPARVLYYDGEIPGHKAADFPIAEYLKAKGVGQGVAVVYDSVANRWKAWEGTGVEANHSDPPDGDIVAAAVRKAKDAGLPAAFLHFERRMDPGAKTTPLDVARAIVRAREAAGPDYPLYWFTDTTEAYDEPLTRFAMTHGLTGSLFYAYNTDEHALSKGDTWYKAVREIEERLAGTRLDGQKVALVCPYYQMWFGSDPRFASVQHLADTPVPLKLWRRQIEHLRAGDWAIFVWAGSLSAEPVKPHLDYVAELYGKGREK